MLRSSNGPKSPNGPRSPTFGSPRNSALRSPRRSSLKSPKSFSFGLDDEASAISLLSGKSTVLDLVDESERTMAAKESNIAEYRQSVLVQLDEAERKRECAVQRRSMENAAAQFRREHVERRVMAQWREYAVNEVAVWREQRECAVVTLCWNRWRRMYGAICTVQRRRYLREWRECNVDHHRRARKVLSMPTRSRHRVLTLLSVVRLCRRSFGRRRSRLISKRLFSRHRLAIELVLFTTWRTMAQQQNMAAFRVIAVLQKGDRRERVWALRRWRAKTAESRAARKRLNAEALRMRRRRLLTQHFVRWKVLFVHEATTKMALLHWANTVEITSFHRWRRFTEWSVAAQCSADRVWAANTVRTCFVFWSNEFVRIRNERQWARWRLNNRAIAHRDDVVVVKEPSSKRRDQRTEKPVMGTKDRDHAAKKGGGFLSTVRSADPTPNSLFFPYCGESGADKQPMVDLNRISSEPNGDRLSYVKHCELESILIPICGSPMPQ